MKINFKLPLYLLLVCLLVVAANGCTKPALPPTPIKITTTSLPVAIAGQSYSQQLTATGGVPPYQWTAIPGTGTLPPGITLNSSGILGGVPSASGQFKFTVQVTDSRQNTQSLALR